MPVIVDDRTYYRTAEVCRLVGISRNTLFRWLRKGMFSDVEYRDWRGWRLFTPAQIETIRIQTNQVTATVGEGRTVDTGRQWSQDFAVTEESSKNE
jgi:phage antirepressor YoqD-like protein